MGYCLCYI